MAIIPHNFRLPNDKIVPIKIRPSADGSGDYVPVVGFDSDVSVHIGALTQSGSWTVTADAGVNLNTSALALEAGNLATLANTVAGGRIKVDPTGVTSPVSLATLPALSAGAATIGGVTLPNIETATTGGAAPSKMIIGGLVYNSTPPTPTNGQVTSLQGDANGNLKVSVVSSAPVLVENGSYPTDAFGRIRVSDPHTIFDIVNQYFIDPNFWDGGLSVNGTRTHLPNESTIQLSTVAGTNGNSSILQTKNYFRYRPGKSHLINMTFAFGTAAINVVRRAGYFDNSDGVFLEQNGTTDVAMVMRSSVSGSPVDTRVIQPNWNIDKFDGTGPSGITLDLTKTQILQIDLQWLGVGTVRYGFVTNGVFYAAHHMNNANNLTVAYMKTANLPLRYSISNSGVAPGGAATMRAICCVVMSEGSGDVDKYLQYSANNAVAPVTVSTRQPILSIRPALTFNSITNRGLLIPLNLDAIATSGTDNFLVEIVLNGTLGGTPAFNTVNSAASMAEVDVAATSISGGIVLHSCYITSQSRTIQLTDLVGKMALSINAAANAQDVISIVATHIGNGSGPLVAAFNWIEKK